MYIGMIDAATVLYCPLDLQKRAVIICQLWTPAVTTSRIILGVEKSENQSDVRPLTRNSAFYVS